jgi:2',3'-cyclic-nucleotide 2'-phosphodiesterase (5'-nucleotidase family)
MNVPARLVLRGVLLAALLFPALASAAPDALFVVTGDQHSSYSRSPRFLGLIDRLRAENPGVPLAVLLNGDTQEYGNLVARRSAGAGDFAFFAALARRVPTVLNLGNHDPEFFDVPTTVARVRATGVVPIGNLRAKGGTLHAEPSTVLRLGAFEVVVAGVTTDRLSTYRVPLRPELDLANPVVWAKEKFPALLAAAPLKIVLSHSGLEADRAILPLLPAGTLFAGAHDHLRFVHAERGVTYFHSGSWNCHASVVRLTRAADGTPQWQVEQVALDDTVPADPELTAFLAEQLRQHLSPDDTAVLGRLPAALDPPAAARYAVAALRAGAGVDAAFVGNTTFGDGLPAGAVTRFDFDACVRFEGSVFVAEVTGTQLAALVAERTNQGPDTPWEKRRGDFLVGDAPAAIDPARTYRIVTTDWGAKNTQSYFGGDLGWRELAGPKFKELVARALAGAPTAATGH